LPNDLNDPDLKLNIASVFMDKGRVYAVIKKLSPFIWFTRSMTRFMIKNYSNKKMIGAEIGVEYGLNAKTMLKYLSIEKLYLIDPYFGNQDNISCDQRYHLNKPLVKFRMNWILFISMGNIVMMLLKKTLNYSIKN